MQKNECVFWFEILLLYKYIIKGMDINYKKFFYVFLIIKNNVQYKEYIYKMYYKII